MSVEATICTAARSIASLAPAVSSLDKLSVELADIDRACARGYFTPDEDERVRARFAQYLTARAGLLQTIEELRPIALAQVPNGGLSDDERLRAFALAYTATAVLVRAGRFIVDRFAPNKIVQRKLNEAEPRFGIPRKQYTQVYKSLTSPVNAWRIHQAREFADSHRASLMAMQNDPLIGGVLEHLHQAEDAIRLRKTRYALARLRYRWHSLRRRRASAFAQAMFGLFELSERIIADLRNPFHTKRVTPEIQRQLGEILQPGDVLVSRHDDAVSNLFLPGYWIHASLHIGTETQRRQLGVQLDAQRSARWIDPIRVLEARKDGVRFRPLDDTLAVDAVALIRPRLARQHLAEALERAVTHEGKLYDFEFDFFRSDRLVCTEVVYRAYHGVGGMEFALRQRAGRPTLSAEDLLDMAVEGRGFEPVAVFGAPTCATQVVSGSKAPETLIHSYRR